MARNMILPTETDIESYLIKMPGIKEAVGKWY